MRTIIVLAVAALSLAAAPQQKPVAHISGSGTITAFEGEVVTFDFDVETKHGNASGFANWSCAGDCSPQQMSYTIAIDCVDVHGDEAWISGTLVAPSGSYPAGQSVGFRVLDSKAGDLSSVPAFTGITCGDQQPFQMEPIASGSITVH